MRFVTAVFSVGLLVAIAGCNSTRWGFLRNPEHNGTAKPPEGVQSVESLVAYLNNNAGRINTIQANSLDITATMGDRINLTGKLVAQKPDGFRMSINGPLGGIQFADLGSNRDEFWFWIKGPIGQPQPQYYCSYKDLDKGVRFMPVPFQPQWILETLGLGPYGPPEHYTLEHDDQNLRLIEKARSPQGITVRKVIVMKRRAMKAPEPQVTHYLLIDDLTNKEICSAHIAQVMVDAKTGAVVPKKLDLNWRERNATLSILLDRVAVNVGLPETAFVRRPMVGVQSYNLARSAGQRAPAHRRLRPAAVTGLRLAPAYHGKGNMPIPHGKRALNVNGISLSHDHQPRQHARGHADRRPQSGPQHRMVVEAAAQRIRRAPSAVCRRSSLNCRNRKWRCASRIFCASVQSRASCSRGSSLIALNTSGVISRWARATAR